MFGLFKKVMSPEEFKARWESDDNGGGITNDDIADCAKGWGLYSSPRTQRLEVVRYEVLLYAGVPDAEEYAPVRIF